VSAFSKWRELVHTAKEVTFWIIQRLTEWRSSEPFSRPRSDMPGLLQAIAAQDRIGWLAFFEGCIAVEWAGVQEAHFLWLGRRNAGKRWATSLVVKLLEVAWDLWDHRNQVKKHLETTQDIARREATMLAARSEHAFGRSGLPRRDWRLFKRPLSSILSSSLHCMDAWLLPVEIARARKIRRQHARATTPRYQRILLTIQPRSPDKIRFPRSTEFGVKNKAWEPDRAFREIENELENFANHSRRQSNLNPRQLEIIQTLMLKRSRS
jgi:hypothetical protein